VEETSAADDPQVVSSPEAAYERLELHRIVVESVKGLPEPLRTTVLLRYFEERSSAEIARQMRVPAGTVRWRLKSALEHLREELDQRFGGNRRSWAVALAPLGVDSGLSVVKGGLLLATLKTKSAPAWPWCSPF
jgi:hypothetical protein